MSMLQVELIELRREIITFIEEQTRQELRDNSAVLLGKFVDNLLQDSMVRGVGALDKAVQQHNHLVELEGVLGHDGHEVIDTVLKEEELCTLRVGIEQTICDHAQGLDH